MLWDDAIGVQTRVGREIVHLDVAHVGSISYRRQRIAPAHEGQEIRKVCNALVAGLEVHNIHGIELLRASAAQTSERCTGGIGGSGGSVLARAQTHPHECHEQAQVDPRELGPRQEGLAIFTEMRLEPVERGKQLGVGRPIRFLGARKASGRRRC